MKSRDRGWGQRETFSFFALRSTNVFSKKNEVIRKKCYFLNTCIHEMRLLLAREVPCNLTNEAWSRTKFEGTTVHQ